MPYVGSLFSGIGGIELGFEHAGFNTSWCIEYEPYAQSILRKRFPNAKIYGDITKIDFRDVPKVEILTGGFPCQDISNAGKRAGIEGSRSSLWKYYCEAIRILRPKIAFIENVAALTNRGLNVVLADLAGIGYDAEWYCVSASSVGADHQRKRMFIVAYPNNCGHLHGQAQEFSAEGRKYALGQFEPSSSYVSDANSFGCNNGGDNREGGQVQDSRIGSSEENKQERSGWFDRSREICEDVSDTSRERLEGHRKSVECMSEQSEHASEGSFSSNVEDSICNGNDEGNREEVNRGEERGQYSDFTQCTSWWSAEPDVGRVADGISFRVDRIRCLGNAVVPQCAEVFARAIKEIEEERMISAFKTKQMVLA